MNFERCSVYNFDGALRGMRNPKNSWHLSDSSFAICNFETVSDYYAKEIATEWAENDGYEWDTEPYYKAIEKYHNWLMENGLLISDDNTDMYDVALIGPKDMRLAKQLIAAGPEHRKFLRQIFISVDITAPLYWWKEFDTYKVATVANSTSTMHKLDSKPITLDCFEIGDFENIPYPVNAQREDLKYQPVDEDVVQMVIIPYLEYLRTTYNKIKKDNPEEAKKYWKELVRWLPESWLQTRTWTGNYETLRSMYHQRNNHKLVEWHAFCGFIESLPYAKELIIN